MPALHRRPVALLAVLGRLAGTASGDTLSALPKDCTLTKVKDPHSHPNSDCYNDHWCHGGHNWCKAHDGKRTLEHGAPGCSDPASGGETGTLCDPKKVTAEYCAQVCWTWDRYTFSGATQMADADAGGACYCGNEMDKAGQVQPPASCSAPCPAGGEGNCGAPAPSWFINVQQLQPEGCEGLSAEEEGALTMDTLFFAALVYLLAMLVYNQKYLKRRGYDVIPHATHLKQISELVQEGVKFSYAKLAGKQGAVPTERTALLGDAAGENRGSHASRASLRSDHHAKAKSGSQEQPSGKREKKEKTTKKKRSKSKSKSSRADGADTGGAPAAPETAVEKQQRLLQEQAVLDSLVHSSQQKIKVVSVTL
jgi:hypothetical protein